MLFCLGYALSIQAQNKNFVFIQSDTKQPFYANVNGKTFGSNLNGYLIIPQLSNGNYPCKIGFPQNKFPEQQFSLQINNTDKGYELKNFGEKGWGLYDILQFNIQMADKQTTPVDAGVANPFAMNDKVLVKGEPVKTPPATIIVPAAPVAEEKVNIPSANLVKRASAITKTYEKQGARGIDMVFIDATSTKPDTIILFVPINDQPASIAKVCQRETKQLSINNRQSGAFIRKEQVFL
jgi:hypothetical protein